MDYELLDEMVGILATALAMAVTPGITEEDSEEVNTWRKQILRDAREEAIRKLGGRDQ